MKNKFLLLLALLPLMTQAQITKVTEEQKQQALQHVTEFCNLLTQWGNGQRTLDTKIYALCSGNDCSAYDDVSTNKETTLRNYLLGIQKKYPKSYPISIKNITLNRVYYQPELIVNTSWAESAFGASVNYDANVISYKNAFIVYDVTQSNGLNLINKKIIYDVKAGKITGFITGSGTYISFIEGLRLTAEKSYKAAIEKFDYAASNSRASLKKDCYESSAFLSILLNDWEAAQRYAELAENQTFVLFTKGIVAFYKKDLDTAIGSFLKLEQLSENNEKLKTQLPSLWFLISNIYACPLTYNKHYNSSKATYYIKKSANAGYIPSGYYIYQFCYMEWIHKEDISIDEAFKYLEWSAKNDYPSAYFPLGEYSEYVKEYDTAINWYEKSAKVGNPFGMACLGRLLIQKGGSYKKTGCEWLRKSLDNKLEKFLNEAEDLEMSPIWPKSKEDVEKLLYENNGSSSTTIQPTTPITSQVTNNQTPTSTSSTTTPSATSSTYNYSNPSYHYKKYHGPFNKAKDEYIGGFSMGYIQKQWVVDYDNGETEKMGMFDDDKYLKGIQVGFRIDPQFGAGFGMNTGLFYEYCWAKSEEEHDSYGAYHYTYEEHGLYLPLHLKFTMNFSKWFQLSFYGGCAINYGISGIMYLRGDDTTYDSIGVFSEDDWRRWNFMFEYGASIRILDLQFDFSMARGLNDWSDTEGYKIKQGRPMNISMSICF